MMPKRTDETAAVKSSAVATASRALRDLIVRGALAPGAPLIERDIAAKLLVGRTTAQSALQILEREGYVVLAEAGKYSRASVAPLTRQDMQDLHELLGALNGMAARRSASLAEPVRHRLADELERLNRALLRAAEADPVGFTEIYECDQAFHGRCIAAASNRRIEAVYDSIAPQRERYARMYAASLGGKTIASVKEHERIIAAIRKGDPVAAELATVKNFVNAAARLGVVIESLGERGSW